MDPKTWASVKTIFSEIVDLGPSERKIKLDKVCNGDGELRAEVEVLLRSNDEAEHFIERPAFSIADAIPADYEPATGKLIGHYRIVREIGRGGMGTVFLATRDDGEFQQQVAIKVVSSAFLGRENLRRFRQERQILAGLNHPNIARLLDGGVTDEGLPFLVMEYVDGEPLSEHAEKKSLSIRERLSLFLKICRAFSYAHSNLIVHRDIKPSNILVSSDGEPKLLDFGLAKIMDIESDDVRTATNLRALTPAYASPEQLRGDAVTTASDIYSLGVVLYELLTEARPFDHDAATLERMIQIVSHSEPALPSHSVSAARGSRISPSELKGDVDNIILTAMRAEPARRYVSVDQLADDIERHLAGLPISAVPDTFSYRATKFVRRHRLGVASATIIALILIGGIVATAWQASVAARERDQANVEKEKAEQLNEFLQSILSAAAPTEMGKNAKVIEVLDDAARRIDTELANQPELRARALTTIGRTYDQLGLPETAEPKLREAVRIYSELPSVQNKDKTRSLIYLSACLNVQFKFEEAEVMAAEVIENERSNSPGSPEMAQALFGLGELRVRQGRYQEAETLLNESVAICDSNVIPGEFECSYYRISLGRARQFSGDLNGAGAIYRQSLEVFRRQPDRYAIRIADLSVNLGDTLIAQRHFIEGMKFLQDGDDIYHAQLGESISVVISQYYLAKAHLEQHQNEKALRFATQAVEIGRKLNWMENRNFIGALQVTGLAHTRLGKPHDGEPYLREAVERAKDHLQPEDPRIAAAINALNECQAAKKDKQR